MQKLFIISFMLCVSSCSHSTFKAKWTKEKSPPSFTARFETSKGNFEIEVTREWSPQAADRFFQLLKHHYFDNILFYRVVPNFVVQFGNTDTLVTKKWNKYKVQDEPVIKSNLKATLSFARSGKDTRGTDLFINLKDNKRLDTINYSTVVGFPVFGTVVKGMETVEAMYGGYANKTMDVYDSLSSDRTKFLALFPKLDAIKKAYLLKPDK
jgi:peptidyl-prolyl cis-trans isomerase A (cyclophilin A)